MNDDLMFDYLIQMGQMRPEEAEMKRRQAQVDALRKGSMTSPEGQMVGKQYVAPSWTQNLAQLGQGYAAMKGQQGVDEKLQGMNTKQAQLLEEMKRRRMQGGYMPPSTQSLMGDNIDAGGGWNPAQ